MTALRVLHVTPCSEWAWAHGGIPRVVAAQTRGLAQLGVAPTVLTTDLGDRRERMARPPSEPRRGPFCLRSATGTPVVVCPNRSAWLAARLHIPLPAGAAAYLAHDAAAHAVGHLHGCRHLLGMVAARQLARSGVPFVVQPHGGATPRRRQPLAATLFEAWVGRALLRFASALIATSEAERRQLAALGLAAPLSVIPNPVDLDEQAVAPDPDAFRSRWQLGDRPLVLFLGRLQPRRRVELVLRAVAALDVARRPELVIAGGAGGRSRSLETLARELGIASQVVFTGVLPGRRRLEALAAADAVVAPGSDSSCGLVPLEALLCGSPVVATGDGSGGEAVAALGGGLVVEPDSVAALSAALLGLLASPAAWRERAAAAAVEVRARHAAPVVAARLVALYGTLLDDRASAATGT